jgi:hypothetical protein
MPPGAPFMTTKSAWVGFRSAEGRREAAGAALSEVERAELLPGPPRRETSIRREPTHNSRCNYTQRSTPKSKFI